MNLETASHCSVCGTPSQPSPCKPQGRLIWVFTIIRDPNNIDPINIIVGSRNSKEPYTVPLIIVNPHVTKSLGGHGFRRSGQPARRLWVEFRMTCLELRNSLLAVP